LAGEGILPRASLLGQVGTDMNDVVGDHAESDPATDSIRSFIERSSQPVPAFENADASLTASAPFLKLFEPRLLLPLLAGRALGVVARIDTRLTPISSALDSLAAEKNDSSEKSVGEFRLGQLAK